ncbi:VOC family protein [Paracoccus luteus]|uniref:VOC family protein n=1 Tax=Paracoccus luteus TaxID=2508543 RepID=UPI00106F7A66|nr:VOC family protein [Paracoccus luteus]
MSTNPDTFDLGAAPMRIGRVRLRVRDLDKVAEFYARVMGLRPLSTAADRVTLGTATTPLLELTGDATLSPRDPRDAGLFHTAFLLPGRPDLGRWLAHVRDNRIPLQGASDHIVSEAVYLADPEGNGIEVYADRAPSGWRGADGEIHMTTEPMDGPGVLASAGGTAWTGFPEQGSVGHVHLQVGDTAAADRFYRDVLGFDVASRYPGASFFGSGGYHHQLAGNVWNSRGAGARPDGAAGLDAVEIVLNDASLRGPILTRAATAGVEVSTAGDAPVLRDPWGTRIALAA